MTNPNPPAADNSPAAVIWDMDGTLTDTEPLWAIATYEMSERMGRRLTVEKHAATMGGTFDNTFRVCAEHAGITPAAAARDRYRRILFDRVAELFSERLTLNPGVRDILDGLRARGTAMYVATNTPRELADLAITAVGRDYFADTVCGDEVPRGKPAPDIYREVANRAGVSPGQCLVFEDSPTGMTAARDAGCRVVGVPGPAGDGPPDVPTLGELTGDPGLTGADFRGVDVAAIDALFWSVTPTPAPCGGLDVQE
ncbi:HAD family hydrolase [Corynebacterium antarcticum]|uniref:HAD family hydrolase n=1 Tax=Corynebacterium antarcticum TaxID=2800405 RepID=UPI0020063C89|nr:HAD family phosphatase [Corynebacterium antarcticum]MCK7660490.1 HAD family phosphatase [Corynebacterium antarcticum]MCX7539804.1 HAD family phosphatase [Corynebacterium antarcticum]